MRVVLYFILIFGFIKPSFAQDIVVKQVWGNVQFVMGEQKIAVKNLLLEKIDRKNIITLIELIIQICI